MSVLSEFLANQTDDHASKMAIIQRALGAIRQHLGMEVAYVSRFVENESVFEHVDAPGLESRIKPGDRLSLDNVYCKHILDGRLPELMPDTADFELAQRMPITRKVPIGAHLSVPIMLNRGQPYGMFCCLSRQPNATLNERDLHMMRAFADMTAFQIEATLDVARALDDKHSRIEQAVRTTENLSVVYQPIWDFYRGQAVGFEALSRFAVEPVRSPDQWFHEAAEIGRGAELELASIRAALENAHTLPAGLYISVNASPAAILDPGFAAAIASGPPERRIVLEITEHAPVADYPQLIEKLDGPRHDGMLLAIDDAGAGYSSFQHIIRLQPDIIKLDMTLTRHIDTDAARRALASALIYFGQETGCQIVAEGIETADELKTLKSLGVTHGQGYLLGRPTDPRAATELVEHTHASAGSSARKQHR